MKFKLDTRYLQIGITAFLVIATSILFGLFILNFGTFLKIIDTVVSILTPFIIGFVIAYLLSPIVKRLEKKVFIPLLNKIHKKKPAKVARMCAITISILLGLAIVAGLITMLVPQLIDSIVRIIKNQSVYLDNLQEWVNNIIASNDDLATLINTQFDNISKFINSWATTTLLPKLNTLVGSVTTGIFDFIIGVKDLLVGIIISVYLLYNKETFFKQFKKLMSTIFNLKFTERMFNIIRQTHSIFSGFIVGKIIDSMIVGVICFIGLSLMSMPYALLISVVVGITDVIPFFGPFIGAVPCGLLILMIDPIMCLYFVIFILALQQFDGNVIAPKILGDSTGLASIWVIFAILLGGGMFGFVGMVIGVPTFAVIYALSKELCEYILAKKGLPIETEKY